MNFIGMLKYVSFAWKRHRNRKFSDCLHCDSKPLSTPQCCCADRQALCTFPVAGIVMTQISFDFYQVLRTSCEAQMELTGSQNSR